jgi:hypothetical protein
MRVMTGTSGFSYAAWRGSFYPKKLPQAAMLAFYAGKLDAVEINSTVLPAPGRLAARALGGRDAGVRSASRSRARAASRTCGGWRRGRRVARLG